MWPIQLKFQLTNEKGSNSFRFWNLPRPATFHWAWLDTDGALAREKGSRLKVNHPQPLPSHCKPHCISEVRPMQLFAPLNSVLFNLSLNWQGTRYIFSPLTQQDFPQWTRSLWFYILLLPSTLICVWRPVEGYSGLLGFNTSPWKGLFQGLEKERERKREIYAQTPHIQAPD